MKHLKDRQEYIDRYDRHTLEECLDYISAITPEAIKEKDTKGKLTDEVIEKYLGRFNGLLIWTIAGERYLRREDVITEWMKNDEKKDRTYEEAVAPEVKCLTCGGLLIETFKDLQWDYDNNTGRVLFMYECRNKCLPRRAFYDDGEEWETTPRLCAECGTETEYSAKKTKKKIIFTDTCPKCGHVEKDEMELSTEKESEPDPKVEKAFRINQERYCSEKFGEDYKDWKRRADQLSEIVNKQKEREEKKELYDKVKALKKLSIPSIKDHLEYVLEKTQYRNLKFKEPDLARIVSVEFNIEDPTDSNEYDSRMKLKKLIQESLKETNWRLMSDGISYRLGVLSGRIRIYEDEDELAKLMEKQHGR